jgi:hypothetical protein
MIHIGKTEAESENKHTTSRDISNIERKTSHHLHYNVEWHSKKIVVNSEYIRVQEQLVLACWQLIPKETKENHENS